MLVILDTTETYDSLFLDTPDFKLLHRFLSAKPATLVVPRIVIQETINHYRDRLTTTLEAARDKCRSLNRLIPAMAEIRLPEIDVDEAVSEYEKILGKRLKGLAAEQPGYEGVQVASIVDRALKRRKPFDLKGHVGFRDAVIWETILLRLSLKPDDAVIITGNTRDFGTHGTLAQHLCEDLKAIGLNDNSLTVCERLGKFVEVFVKPHLETLKEIQRQIEQGGYGSFSPKTFFRERHSEIRRELKSHVKGFRLDGITRKFVGSFRDPSLIELSDDVHWSRANDVWSLNEDEIAVGIDFYVGGEIECVHEIEEDYGISHDERFVGSVMATLYMTIILNRHSGDALTWELDDAEIEPDCWHCDET